MIKNGSNQGTIRILDSNIFLKNIDISLCKQNPNNVEISENYGCTQQDPAVRI